MTDTPSAPPSPPAGPGFADHFSGHAAEYARHRPTYPDALFAALAELAPGRGLAWDCATGNGQAAVALARHFERVHATDASAAQVARATPHPGVTYAVAPAEASGLPDESVDLLTVAQAYHWFDAEAFHLEARRVLAPGGVLAVWCYDLATVSPEVDALVLALYQHTAPWWPPERAHLEAGYATLPWPWPAHPAPVAEMQVEWSAEALLGYLGTWSGVRRCAEALGVDPLAARAEALRAAFGPGTRTVRWPLTLKVARQP